MESKATKIVVTGEGAKMAKQIARRLKISEDAAVRLALLFFVRGDNTPDKKKN